MQPEPKQPPNLPPAVSLPRGSTGGGLGGFLWTKLMSENQIKYQTYLSTREWRRKRERVYERENGICQGCRDEPIEHIHHATYSHAFDELLFQLIGLCENCHRKAHFKSPSWNPWTP
jgi:5-methylcytosine-specific restriction endonuclease McrA